MQNNHPSYTYWQGWKKAMFIYYNIIGSPAAFVVVQIPNLHYDPLLSSSRPSTDIWKLLVHSKYWEQFSNTSQAWRPISNPPLTIGLLVWSVPPREALWFFACIMPICSSSLITSHSSIGLFLKSSLISFAQSLGLYSGDIFVATMTISPGSFVFLISSITLNMRKLSWFLQYPRRPMAHCGQVRTVK